MATNTTTHHHTTTHTNPDTDWLDQERLVSPRLAAEYLGVHINTVYVMTSSGQLRSVMVRGARRIPLEALRELAGRTD